jgi:hypothetical protein
MGDESMCFIFDTGAQSVTVPLDLVHAVGWQDRLGDEETIRGVGGAKVVAAAIAGLSLLRSLALGCPSPRCRRFTASLSV